MSPNDRVEFCHACRRRRDAERHEALLARVERMWAAGKSYAEISAELGYRYVPGGKCPGISPLIAELRKQGRAAYRYAWAEKRAAA
jgi:hypothetical protein